jgi:hypothetical protein
MDRTRTSRNPSSHNEDGNPSRSAPRTLNGGDTLETKFAFTRFPSNRNHFARDFRSTARSATILISGSNQGAAVSNLNKMAVRNRHSFVRGDVGTPGDIYGNAIRETRRGAKSLLLTASFSLAKKSGNQEPRSQHGFRFLSWIPGFPICLPPLLPEQLLF